MILNKTELRSNNESAQSQQDITLCKILIPPTGCYHHHYARKSEREREGEIQRGYSEFYRFDFFKPFCCVKTWSINSTYKVVS